MKNKTKLKISAIGIILLLGILAYYGGLFAIGYDDYLIEDEFTIPSPALIEQNCQVIVGSNPPQVRVCQDNRWKVTLTPSCGVPPTSKVRDGKLILHTQGDNKVEAEYLINLKNNDLKIAVELETIPAYQYSSTSATMNIGGLYTDSVQRNEREGVPKKEYIIELIKDIENKNLYHIEVNGIEVNSKEILGDNYYLKFVLTSSGRTTGCGGDGSSAELRIDYLKSRPYYNCEVDTDEVVIKDTFSEGSKFNISTLTYKPVKFCVDSYPAIKRSFIESGVRADIQGQITKKLTRGQNILVEPKTSIEIYYIADYIEGMGERCGLDSAYDTKSKKCIKIISEEEDIIELPVSRETIQVGIYDISFKDELKVADKTITLGTPEYVCSEEKDKANAPIPRIDCWKTELTYGSKKYSLIYGEEKQLNEFLKVKWLPTARYENNKIKENYQNNAILTLTNPDKIIEVEPKEIAQLTDYYLIFGIKSPLELTIKNNLGTFDESGLQITQTKQLLTSQNMYQENIQFKEGVSNYKFNRDVNTYGKQTYGVVAWYKIGNQIIFDNQKIINSIEVVNKVPTETKEIEKEKIIEKTITIEKIIIQEKEMSILETFKYLWNKLINIFG